MLCSPFHEVQSGKDDDDRRPQLKAALEAARKAKAPIIVAKLDRLSRDVHFISGLMKHKVAFIVADLGPPVTHSGGLFVVDMTWNDLWLIFVIAGGLRSR